MKTSIYLADHRCMYDRPMPNSLTHLRCINSIHSMLGHSVVETEAFRYRERLQIVAMHVVGYRGISINIPEVEQIQFV